ncbi:hypothetical protein EV356DRAFT_299154 [Viridothelium virens]|uniref:BZIP domain-containing protein n=1 Tax=Viridothelium virens TaxID=1048519 RepID=A0A6A6GZR5_VIRVR|nr:hypothetical protein EV356DRAFT_299154 [Viridothelium virens]
MAGYGGRRAPNVSEYIRTLNQLPSAADIAAQQSPAGFEGLDEDLAPFVNTEFFDYDAGEMTNPAMSMGFGPGQTRPENASGPGNNNTFDFLNTDYQFNEFPDLPTVQPDASAAAIAAHGNGFPHQFNSPTDATGSSASSPVNQYSQGTKRKASEVMSPPTGTALEETSRLAAEEDKRRRNTAASARFRVKKKQREQALEKTAKDMTEKVNALEARISQLEMENKWLKGLITEKNEARDGVGELKEKYKAGKEAEKIERSLDTRKDGVGTLKTEKA